MIIKLSEIKGRISQVETELRSLYDTAAEKKEDLTGESLERWNTLDAELVSLREQQSRAERRDEIDRNSQGRNLENRGEDQSQGVSVFGLTREQRMSQYVAAP